MEAFSEKKTKALFVISADEAFSDKHPFWTTIQEFRKHYAQIHLLIVIKGKIPEEGAYEHQDDQLLIYYVRQQFLFLRLPHVWPRLQFNLRWQDRFQPDVVISYTGGIASLLGYLLAWQNKKKFFMEGSAHLLGQSHMSLKFLINRFLLRRAEAVLVPGQQTAALFTSVFSIPPAQLLSVTPPLEIGQTGSSVSRYDFHADHEQYNFYISSAVYLAKDVYALIAVHSIIAARYPRVALFILADPSFVPKVKRIIKRAKAFGVFVYEQNDSVLSYINGSHVYLAVSTEQDIDVMMVKALGVETSVITKSYGIAPELFKGTEYEHNMIIDGNPRTIANAVIALIEDQRARTEYGLNTGVLLARAKLTTTAEYAAEVAKTIGEIIAPPLITHTAPTTVTPFMEGEEPIIKPTKAEDKVAE